MHVSRHVNEGGLQMLYEILLDYAKPEFAAAMDRILAAAEAQRPMLLFCKAGKDRTGLLSMMVMSVAGATDEQILDDYVK